MTLPRLEGWGDQIKNNLPQIAAALDPIINPHREMQMALKVAIAKDPNVLQKFIVAEKDNPGITDNIGGKSFGDYVRGAQMDAPTTFDYTGDKQLAAAGGNAAVDAARKRSGLVSTTEEKRGSQLVESEGMSLDQKRRFKGVLDTLRTTQPDLYAAMEKSGAYKEFFGQTEDEAKVRRGQAVEAQATIQANADFDNLSKKFPDMNSLFKAFDKGELSPSEMGAVLSSPRAEGMKVALQHRLASQRETAQLELQTKRLAAEYNRQDARLAADAKKAEKKLADLNHRQLGWNNVAMNRIVGTIQQKGLGQSEANAMLPQIQGLIDDNAKILGTDPTKVPKAVWVSRSMLEKFGDAFTGGKKEGVAIINPDGTPNKHYNSLIQGQVKYDAVEAAGVTLNSNEQKILKGLGEGKDQKGNEFYIEDIDRLPISAASKENIRRIWYRDHPEDSPDSKENEGYTVEESEE